MGFSNEQLDKLSDLFMSIAKGSLLSALAIPILSPSLTLIITVKSSLTGIAFTYFSLKTLELKKEVQNDNFRRF